MNKKIEIILIQNLKNKMNVLENFFTLPRDPQLSESQNEAYQYYKLGKNLFITGQAGTGKSFLIRKIIKDCKSSKKEFGVTALTGSAACLINGKTIHSWSGLGHGERDARYYIDKILKKFPVKMRYWKTRVLIIDEISMMDIEFFELLSEVSQGVRGNQKPFGGIQIILIGDFYQLPPVLKEKEKQFCFESPIWEESIDVHCILKEVQRQKDTEFQKILQEVRDGNVSQESIETLVSCKFKKIDESSGIVPTKLYSTRKSVDNFNKREFDKLDIEEIYDYEVESTYLGIKANKMSSEEKLYLESQLDKDFPYEPELSLCVGCQVMLLINKDVEAGLVNGSRGVIVGFEEDRPKVRFMNGMEELIDFYEWEYEINALNKVLRKQIPLKLAWAITVHKSQGCTLDCVEIDIGKSVFEYGQSYVALSRVKTLEGLFIKDIDVDKIRSHPKVIAFYQEKF